MAAPEPEEETKTVPEDVFIVQELEHSTYVEPEPVVEEVVEEPVTFAAAEIDFFTIEEVEVMQTLADMGRVFNDEDEAKLVKLTEDLTNWMNKWAPTFEDPESILFEITTPLVTDDMLVQLPVETKTV